MSMNLSKAIFPNSVHDNQEDRINERRLKANKCPYNFVSGAAGILALWNLKVVHPTELFEKDWKKKSMIQTISSILIRVHILLGNLRRKIKNLLRGRVSLPPRNEVLLLAQESLSRFSWPIMLKLVCEKGVHLVLLLLGLVVFQPVKKRYGSIVLFVIRNRQCWREHLAVLEH